MLIDVSLCREIRLVAWPTYNPVARVLLQLSFVFMFVNYQRYFQFLNRFSENL